MDSGIGVVDASSEEDSPMVRALTWFTMLGAVLGGVVGSFLGYRWALWYFNPGNTQQVQAALCPCLANAQDAIETFFRWQLIGAVIGILVVNFIGLIVRAKLARRVAEEAL